MSNYMSNYLTSCQILVILCQIICQIIWHRYIKFQYFYFYFFQTPTRGIFKGDFPFLHFLFVKYFENSHTKNGLVRPETLFWIINKLCCFLQKGGMSKHQNGAIRHTFFKKGSKVPFFGTLAVVGRRLVIRMCRNRFSDSNSGPNKFIVTKYM